MRILLFFLPVISYSTDPHTLNGKIEVDYEFPPWFSGVYRLGMYQVAGETRSTTGKLEGPGRRNVNGTVTDGSTNSQPFNGDFIISLHRPFGDFSHWLIPGQNFRSD